MPVYNHRCTNCGNEEERLCKLSEANKLLTCTKCHQETSERIFTGSKATPLFKGTGYYETDFKGK